MSHGPEAGAAVLPSGATWSAKRVSILLTIVALVLWAVSVSQARFEIGFLGLFGGLSPALFVALGILTIASAVLWFSKEEHGGLLFLQLCILIAAIWSVPYIVRGSPQGSLDIYTDRGFIEFVTETGHYSAKDNWTYNWPLGWVFWGAFGQVSGVTCIPIVDCWLPVLPMVWQFTILPVLFVFFRNTIGRVRPNYCWAALWVFYVGNWFDVLNSGAQSFGIFFGFALLAVLTMAPAWEQSSTRLGARVSAIGILVASAVAHLLGSVVAVAITAGVVASRRIRANGLVLLAVVMVVAWTVFGSIRYLSFRLPTFLSQGIRLDVATQQGVFSPLSGDPAHEAVAGVRILLTGLLLIAAGLGILLGWKLKDDRRTDITVLCVCACCAAAAVVIGSSYKAELYQRFYVFLLPAIAYFAVKLLRHRATVVALLVILLAAIPLNFIAKYGNQTLDYMSPGYLRGAESFYDHTTMGYVAAVLPMGRMDDFDEYKRSDLLELEITDGRMTHDGELSDPLPRYMIISNHERAWYGFFLNLPGFVDYTEARLNAAGNVALVYANPDLSLYVHEKEG